MAKKLNPADPFSKTNPEMAMIPEGVTAVNDADNGVVAVTVNGYQMRLEGGNQYKPARSKLEEEQRIMDIAKQTTHNKTEDAALQQTLSTELTRLTAEQRSCIISFMAKRINPDDPLSKTNLEWKELPKGVTAISNGENNIMAATINGWEIAFNAPPRTNANSVQAEERRLIDIAKQKPHGYAESKAQTQALAEELAHLTVQQKEYVVKYMAQRFNTRDPLNKGNKEWSEIPKGVQYGMAESGGRIGWVSINDISARL
jgi:hypothetical protein